MEPDLLIVGAGPVGCVVAERAATLRGWTSLVIDRRPHLAGHCYDELRDGILVHRYGPHYFRTNNPDVVTYLSAFTDWIPGRYLVRSRVGGRLLPFPINRRTLEAFYGTSLTTDGARALIERVRDRSIREPSNCEEFLVGAIGRELYEAFYRGYTEKQWGRSPRALDMSVCQRIPIRFDDDERYVDHRFQVMPALGYTRMFERMVARPEITVRLNTDFAEVRGRVTPRVATVYSGCVDDYFDHRLGRLEWRSLHFDFVTYGEEFRQPCVQINYPDEFEYTRSVEIKHVTGQRAPHTVVAYEYPRSHGDPYYPIPTPPQRALYTRYEALADEERRRRRVFFAGRLARYAYINMDEAVEMAQATFEEIWRTCSG